MKSVLFITGNKRKMQQAKEALAPFGINVEHQDCDVDEIQSLDPKKIGIAKAKAAYAIIQKPLAINDHSWAIHSLNGFPGGYMKDVNMWLSSDDLLKLLEDKEDRSATLTEHVIYYDGSTIQEFSVEFNGRFINEKRGKGNVSMERVFVYDGSNKTIAECIDRGEHARDIHRSAWSKFGKWYKENG